MTVVTWFAFALAAGAWALIVAVVVFAALTWRRVSPSVAPLLSMFGAPAMGSAGTSQPAAPPLDPSNRSA